MTTYNETVLTVEALAQSAQQVARRSPAEWKSWEGEDNWPIEANVYYRFVRNGKNGKPCGWLAHFDRACERNRGIGGASC